jgi:hypothetical protein
MVEPKLRKSCGSSKWLSIIDDSDEITEVY